MILSAAYGPLAGFLGRVGLPGLRVHRPDRRHGLAGGLVVAGPVRIPGRNRRARIAGTIAIAGFALAHASGHTGAGRVQGLATTATVALIAAFIAAGLWAGRGHWDRLAQHVSIDRSPPAAFFVGLVLVSYAYTGWNAAAYVAGELDDPHRGVSRAVGAGTGVVIALYLGLNVVIALGLPIAELRSRAALDPSAVERSAALASESLFGPRGGALVSILSGLVLLASLERPDPDRPPRGPGDGPRRPVARNACSSAGCRRGPRRSWPWRRPCCCGPAGSSRFCSPPAWGWH